LGIIEIPYCRLEDKVKAEFEIIEVTKSKSSLVPFYFSHIPAPNSKIAREVQGLKRVVEYSVNHAYFNYSALFRDKSCFSEFLESIVSNLFFEDAKFYDSQNYSELSSIGVYIQAPIYADNNFPIEKGIHIRIGGSNPKKTKNYQEGNADLIKDDHPNRTLVHEIGHGLHDFLCTKGLIEHRFNDYDDKMKEALAITAARTVGKREYEEDPHKTALELVTGMELFPFFKNKSLAAKLKYLLYFTDHLELAEAIRVIKENFPPLRITSS